MTINDTPLITDEEIAELVTGYDHSTVVKLLKLRRGPDDASMATHGLFLTVNKHMLYEITNNSILPVTESGDHDWLDLEQTVATIEASKPPCLTLEAIWDPTPVHSGATNNILGDNGRLLLHNPLITIPCVEATSELLAYYGAILLKPGDKVRFQDAMYPIWSMTIKEKYIDRFLMSETGGGFYLEYHHDQPHYHHAINGSGYYLLAKWNENNKMEITGFRIPQGHAVYTKKGAIHCDAGLIGDYLVGYTTSENCSTVLLRSIDPEAIVRIKFNPTS